MIMYEIFVWAAIALMSAALIGIVAWLVWPLMFPRTPDLEGTTRRLTIPPMNDAATRAMVRTATDRAARHTTPGVHRRAHRGEHRGEHRADSG